MVPHLTLCYCAAVLHKHSQFEHKPDSHNDSPTHHNDVPTTRQPMDQEYTPPHRYCSLLRATAATARYCTLLRATAGASVCYSWLSQLLSAIPGYLMLLWLFMLPVL